MLPNSRILPLKNPISRLELHHSPNPAPISHLREAEEEPEEAEEELKEEVEVVEEEAEEHLLLITPSEAQGWRMSPAYNLEKDNALVPSNPCGNLPLRNI